MGITLDVPIPSQVLSSFLSTAIKPYIVDASEIADVGGIIISSHSSQSDPVLTLMSNLVDDIPTFTYGMPVQLMILGVTITLLTILLIHLLFTVRYHIPLSRLNYGLQTTAVVLTLVSTAASIQILTDSLIQTSKTFPYMLNYIEVPIPGDDWSRTGRSGWITFQAIVTVSVHASQIQFLTLLFPSRLEARLIFIILGPIALSSAMLNYTELASDAKIVDLGEAIRDTANSTLSLLYTCALIVWGFLINRSRAWRTDGGTAAFGAIAIILGILGTAVNFFEVREDRMRWLGGVVRCLQLWQSWVGLWWWVGAGMWLGEAEDVQREEEERQLKIERRARKAARRKLRIERSATLRRRLGRLGPSSPTTEAPEEIELTRIRSTSSVLSTSTSSSTSTTASTSSSSSVISAEPHESSTESTTTSAPTTTVVLSRINAFFHPLMTVLRTAHNEATLSQAALRRSTTNDGNGWGPEALGRPLAATSSIVAGTEGEGREMESRRTGKVDEVPRRRRRILQASGVGGVHARISSSTTAKSATVALEAGGGDEWEDEDVNDNAGASDALNEEWEGKGMEGQSGWSWKGVFAKWRLKDVTRY